MLKLTLTDEDGVVIKQWQSDADPSVFEGLGKVLFDTFEATQDVLDLISDAIDHA